MIIHLNGWPGVGKRTIGIGVADRLGARFIHNHLLHDVAIGCAGYNGAHRWPLYEKVRAAAYEALALQPKTETFVMTNALCRDTPREDLAWSHVVHLAIRRQVPLVPVVLEASLEENKRRVRSEDRITSGKLTDAAALESMMRTDFIQRPDVPELLVLDVTTLSPADAADAIIAWVEEIRPTLQVATLEHLRMRATTVART